MAAVEPTVWTMPPVNRSSGTYVVLDPLPLTVHHSPAGDSAWASEAKSYIVDSLVCCSLSGNWFHTAGRHVQVWHLSLVHNAHLV